MNAHLTVEHENSILVELRVKTVFLEKIQEIAKIISGDRNLYFRNRLCILGDSTLKRDILYEAQSSSPVMHEAENKMCNDLKPLYW
ncbi:integrase [Gossypium australe]|uniref:Integrase n=1 Tax=Gossypium australe TaxID=47621 RepID=A0A5B6VV98_9ROSI|nr:integrase [Gossypium australe]